MSVSVRTTSDPEADAAMPVLVEPSSLLGPKITALRVSAYEIPTERPESDGTLEWDRTIVVLVEARAGDVTGHRLDLLARRRRAAWLVFEEGSHAQQAARRR